MRDVSSQLAQKAAETKEEAAVRLEEARRQTAVKAREVRKQASIAWCDTKLFVNKHPLVVLGLLTSAIMLGTQRTLHTTYRTPHTTHTTHLSHSRHTAHTTHCTSQHTAQSTHTASLTHSIAGDAAMRHVSCHVGLHTGLARQGDSSNSPPTDERRCRAPQPSHLTLAFSHTY